MVTEVLRRPGGHCSTQARLGEDGAVLRESRVTPMGRRLEAWRPYLSWANPGVTSPVHFQEQRSTAKSRQLHFEDFFILSSASSLLPFLQPNTVLLQGACGTRGFTRAGVCGICNLRAA